MDDINILWSKTLDLFQKTYTDQIDKIEYDSYFSNLHIKKIEEDKIYITTDTKWSLEYVNQYLLKLEELFNSINHSRYSLVLLLEEDYLKLDQPIFNNKIEDNLNAEMNFSNFVIGNCNRIAQNASLAVAMKPGISYSPLFIHSNSGLGKTHLLNAIGNYIKSKNPGSKIIYITTEDFVNAYIKAIKDNTIDDFNNIYRNIDVLLIDDIQFIASKDSSSEIFFNIFNNLISHKKQICITSDKPPEELRGIENRLVSRFSSGLTVSIDTPEFETAKAILRKKLELENVDCLIEEEVIDYIASTYNNDIRSLEGKIKRLLFYKLINGQDKDTIDLSFALEAFSDDYNTGVKVNNLNINSIKQTVANYYNLTLSQINSKSRTANITVARHIAMYLVRELMPEISFIQIGKEFGGRDHSTVMKACSKIQTKYNTDASYKEAINKIKSKLS